jgi:DNA modification methylase
MSSRLVSPIAADKLSPTSGASPILQCVLEITILRAPAPLRGEKRLMPIPNQKTDVLDTVAKLEAARSLASVRRQVAGLRARVGSQKGELIRLHTDGDARGPRTISKQHLLAKLEQIEESKTIGRACHYVKRLKKALTEVSTTKTNDLNLNRWKEYSTILTDSLWVLDRRDSSGLHSAWYWGNFIPQIPHQLMLRYTKKGDWVLDPFAGSGTTLLECRRLHRNCLGVELQPSIAKKVRSLLEHEPRRDNSTTAAIEVGDSRIVDFRELLRKRGAASVQLAILHPPYHDIIKFSRRSSDLSNAKSVGAFAAMFGAVVDNVNRVLDEGRYLAVVIGDKYAKGEWIPLGFTLMNEVLKRHFRLKSIVVKNFEETLGKRNQKELWRYRALAGGFYVFKHEYILIFQKKPHSDNG